MAKRLVKIDEDRDVGKLNITEFKPSLPFSGLPSSLQSALWDLKTGEQLQAPNGLSTSVAVDSEVLEAFCSTGTGWQIRMNQALTDWLKN
jgi:hypothetical protein